MNIKLLAITGLAFVFGIAVFSFLSPDNGSGQVNRLSLQADCDLSNQPVCEARDNRGHAVSLSLSPRPVPILKDVEVSATTQGLQDIRTAQLVVEGVNMYMGIQVVPLTFDKAFVSETGHFSGILQLPICTSSTMEWKATLILQSENGEYQAAFPFTTLTP